MAWKFHIAGCRSHFPAGYGMQSCARMVTDGRGARKWRTRVPYTGLAREWVRERLTRVS